MTQQINWPYHSKQSPSFVQEVRGSKVINCLSPVKRACVSTEFVAVATHDVMLVSHCGEYMANGLTNAVRHEFVMIANNR